MIFIVHQVADECCENSKYQEKGAYEILTPNRSLNWQLQQKTRENNSILYQISYETNI